MKHTKYFLFASMFVLTLSCVKEIEPEQRASTDGVTEITASFAEGQTKTVLGSDETSVLWSPNDEISVFYNGDGVKFTSINSTPKDRTIFVSSYSLIYGGTETSSEPYIYAAYPYSESNAQEGEKITLTVPATQTAVEGSFARGAYPSVGRSKDTNIAFYNVCGGVCFSLTQSDVQYVVFRGNANETMAGKVKVKFNESGVPEVTEVVSGSSIIQLNAPTSAGFEVGKLYYFSVLPQILSNGFTMEFNKESARAVRNSTSSVTVKRSVFGKISNADQDLEYVSASAEDLSSLATANCYVVKAAGKYKFKATVKGNSKESVGTPVSAVVLWETFGTDITPNDGNIVYSVSLKDDYVCFSTPSTLNNGNALIAVKDDSDNILWSWHIWVCKDFDPAAKAQVYNNNAGTMMDRNLGATSATPGDVHALGLLYQWGRKDPFLSSSSISGNTIAASTLSWPSAEFAYSENSLLYSISHPTTYLTNPYYSYDWYFTPDSNKNDNLWSSNKTMYDPCPAGWHIPDDVWSKAFGKSAYYESGPWDNTNKGMNFGSGNGQSSNHQLGSASTIWYPVTGCRKFDDGSLRYVGNSGSYWSCMPDNHTMYSLFINHDGYVNPLYQNIRTYGQAVRCIKEGAPLAEYYDLSKAGTANCYVVNKSGNYKFKATVKGGSTESVGTPASAEVLWESFGTNVTPNVGDIVNFVSLKDGYVQFSTTSNLNNGNAVIAVKDAEASILWSWHIWVCKDFDPSAMAQIYYDDAGTMMDRNLGATSATPGDVQALGLLYQWGRKDPFLSGNKSSDPFYEFQQAASTLSWPSAVMSDSSKGTIAYAIACPTTFILGNSDNYDWYYTGSSSTDDTRWQTTEKTKGIYDPCPAGWRVPNGGENGVWPKAFGSSSSLNNAPWDNSNRGMDFGYGNGHSPSHQLGSAFTIWYPAAGWRDYNKGSLANFGFDGQYWSCTPHSGGAHLLKFSDYGSVYLSNYTARAYGMSVRCLSE